MADIFLLKERYSGYPGRLVNDDYKLVDVLRERGHTVAYSEADITTPEQVFQPVIVCSGKNVQAAWVDDPRPMLVTHPNSAQVLGLVNNGGIDGHLDMSDSVSTPTDVSHAIVQGYSSGLHIRGDYTAFASGYGDGQVVLSNDRGATLITWLPGDTRLDGGSFPGKRLFGFWRNLWWAVSDLGYDEYREPILDVLDNAIAWLQADYVSVQQDVTAAAVDLLSQLSRSGLPHLVTPMTTLASDLGTDNLDQVMLQVIRGLASTERYQNRLRQRSERRNDYRWTIREDGTFSSHIRLPQSIWQAR